MGNLTYFVINDKIYSFSGDLDELKGQSNASKLAYIQSNGSFLGWCTTHKLKADIHPASTYKK